MFRQDIPVAERSWLRRLINRLEVDRTVFYSLVSRAWQFVSGPVTVTLLAVWFSDSMRGYFAAFNSILAAQMFFELSLHVVLINLASHEWSRLRLNDQGSPEGDPDALARLVILARSSFRWYAVVAGVFGLCVTAAGVPFLAGGSLPMDEWLVPWIVLGMLTAVLLATIPFTALLEGCGQLQVVYGVRVWQAFTGSLIVWGCIVGGAGLWTAVGSCIVRLLFEFWLIAVRYRAFFLTFLKSQSGDPSTRQPDNPTGPSAPTLTWKQHVWPLQWRLGVQAVFGFFAMHLFTLVIFHYHGDAAGGRVGLTWGILTAIQAGAFSWVETRRPMFGSLVAQRDYRKLDRVFVRLMLISVAVSTIAMGSVVAGLAVLPHIPHRLATNLTGALLPPQQTLALAFGLIIMQIISCQAVYIRAHNRDPFLVLSTVTDALMGLSLWLMGRAWEVWGLAIAYVSIGLLVQLPGWTWITLRCRREWHSEDATPTDSVTSETAADPTDSN